MFFLSIIIILFSLGLLILVHEFGHFISAKKLGVKVEEFCIGFPPRIWSKNYKGTKYSVGLIPFGGFVNMFGEFSDTKGKGSFAKQSIGRRSLITISGVLMNFALALLVFAIGFWTVGLPTAGGEGAKYGGKILKREITILEVVDASPAQLQGLQPRDVVLKIDDQSFGEVSQIQEYLESKAGEEITLQIKRNSDILNKTIVVGEEEQNRGKIGVLLAPIEIVRFPFLRAIMLSFVWSIRLVGLILGFIGNLIANVFQAPGMLESVSGPVGIFFLIREAIFLGAPYFLFLLGQISVTLAIVNLLPFPALDGSRLLFLGIEKMRGRRITPQIENAIYAIGFILLLALLVLISYQDVLKYILGR